MPGVQSVLRVDFTLARYNSIIQLAPKMSTENVLRLSSLISGTRAEQRSRVS